MHEASGSKIHYYAALCRLLINNRGRLKRGGGRGAVIDVSRSERSEQEQRERESETISIAISIYLRSVCLSLSLSLARSLAPAHTSTQRILVTLAHVH